MHLEDMMADISRCAKRVRTQLKEMEENLRKFKSSDVEASF